MACLPIKLLCKTITSSATEIYVNLTDKIDNIRQALVEAGKILPTSGLKLIHKGVILNSEFIISDYPQIVDGSEIVYIQVKKPTSSVPNAENATIVNSGTTTAVPAVPAVPAVQAVPAVSTVPVENTDLPYFAELPTFHHTMESFFGNTAIPINMQYILGDQNGQYYTINSSSLRNASGENDLETTTNVQQSILSRLSELVGSIGQTTNIINTTTTTTTTGQNNSVNIPLPENFGTMTLETMRTTINNHILSGVFRSPNILRQILSESPTVMNLRASDPLGFDNMVYHPNFFTPNVEQTNTTTHQFTNSFANQIENFNQLAVLSEQLENMGFNINNNIDNNDDNDDDNNDDNNDDNDDNNDNDRNYIFIDKELEYFSNCLEVMINNNQ